MSSLWRFVLFLPFFSSLLFSHIVLAADYVSSSDLLLDSHAIFHDYEILSVREEGDEDVIHLRKRAQNNGDCDSDSDCLTYSGWTKDRVTQCNPDIQVDDEGLQERSLHKRGKGDGKITTVCADIEMDPNAQPQPSQAPGQAPTKSPTLSKGFKIRPPNWPDTNTLATRYKTVYDTGDPRKPTEAEWFQLRRRDQKWPDNPGEGERCYDAEHVLEWNLLPKFIEENKNDPDSRCRFFVKFFEDPMKREDTTVKVVKDVNKQLGKGDHFDYVDATYKFSKFASKKTKHNPGKPEPQPLDYVAYQWPGVKGASAKPPNPWEYELVLAHEDLNNKKENVWGGADGKKLFVEPETKGGQYVMSNENGKNNDTLEWLFINKRYGNKKISYWEDNKGTCAAVYQFNNVMAIVQYHNDPLIQELMRAQVRRVGDAFEYLETKVLPGRTYNPIGGGSQETFKARDLKEEWLEWIKSEHKSRLEKLNRALEDKIEVFRGQTRYTTKVKRWDFLRVFQKRIPENTIAKCGFEKDKTRMEKRVELLLDAYNALPKVETELKLD